MRLEAFIADLLYEHDCVVIPDFGGLVANYRSARLNHVLHVVTPPAKHIGFNKNLTSSDGLLAHHISATLGISYSSAQKKLESAVADCRTQLKETGRLVWERIGVFYHDNSGRLQFIPEEQENFLLSSFGLLPVQLHYIGNQSAREDTTVITMKTTPTNRTKVWKIAVAAAIPLLIGAGVLLHNEIKRSGNFSLSSLNPFHEHRVIANYEPHHQAPEIVFDKMQDEQEQTKTTDTKETLQPAENPSNNSMPKPIGKKEIGSNSLRGKHAVIGGAFKVKSNAERFLKRLRQEGFDASLAGTKNGLTLVAYGVYDTQSEAEAALNNIASAGGVRAWIKHY